MKINYKLYRILRLENYLRTFYLRIQNKDSLVNSYYKKLLSYKIIILKLKTLWKMRKQIWMISSLIYMMKRYVNSKFVFIDLYCT